jgi:streptogramin lyase
VRQAKLFGIAAIGAATLAVGPRPAIADGCDLLVAAFGNNKIMRYDGRDGSLVGTFVAPGSGGLSSPHGMTWGPDGHLYVASFGNGAVMRYDGATGDPLRGPDGAVGSAQFVTPGSGGLTQSAGVAFGPDGNLYVSSLNGDRVLRYDGATGAFIGQFVPTGSGGLNGGEFVRFDDNGDLFVAGFTSHAVYRYDGKTGDPKPGPDGAAGTAEFVTPGSGGLVQPHGIEFENGKLYVTSFVNSRVIRYDATDGSFDEVVVTSGEGGISSSHAVAFGPAGDLYAVGFGTGAVLRYDADGVFVEQFVDAGVGSLVQPADLLFFRACACPADVTKDGAVNTGDLVALLAAWGPCESCIEDINHDGTVDTGDLVELLAAWGDCS